MTPNFRYFEAVYVVLITALISGFAALPVAAQTTIVPKSSAQIRLSYAPIVKRASPAVVNVLVRKRTQRQPRFNDPFRDFFSRRFGMPRKRVQNSLGSGVIVSPDGIVVTNYHVIRGGEDGVIKVSFADKREYRAHVILEEEKTDLAIMRIDAPGKIFPFVQLQDSESLQVGDIVFAIGNPFGFGQTVTSGIISALARTQVGASDYQFFIQTDASINPGNSGGALIDIEGKLVGINSAIYSRTGASHGIGFAIPSNMVKTVIQSAVQGKTIMRPWLGARLQPVTSDIADSLGLDRPVGALVQQLNRSGPAQAAGLLPGDIIVAVGGKNVSDPTAFHYRFGTKGVGGKVKLDVIREGKHVLLNVALVVAPEDPPRDERLLRGRSPLSGARVANISPALADELSLKGDLSGVVILEMARATPVYNMGFLRRGDIVLAINGEKVRSTKHLEQLTRYPARRWGMTLSRKGRRLNIVLGG